MVHFVASDAHSSRERRPELENCEAYLNKKVGTKMTRQLFRINPGKMLKGELLDE
jgi:tyrosine-protein phosphatase YwqE